MTDEEKKDYYLKKVKICPDFVMDNRGGCSRWESTPDKKIMLCNYKESDNLGKDHFMCEFCYEFAKELFKKEE